MKRVLKSKPKLIKGVKQPIDKENPIEKQANLKALKKQKAVVKKLGVDVNKLIKGKKPRKRQQPKRFKPS